MSVYCPHCGKENKEAKESCWSCGATLPQEGPESLLGKTVFDSYVLEGILGQGGMAVVYKGRNKLTDQVVAVKVLPPELAVYSEVKTRFVDEARTLAKLEHANIVHLINFAEDIGRLCLVMQYADGETLDDLIDIRGRVEPREAIRINAAVLDAMEHAHRHEVVHRDIKPSNIIVRKDGSVKVTDFGIAKIVRSTKLTQDGQTMGTVRYMSPEQVQGGKIDGRTDIYSLGITLYEALVGDTPFDGDSHFQIMNKHLKEEPLPPSKAGAPIGQELDRVVLKAIQKNPQNRYATAAEMAIELRACPEFAVLGGGAAGAAKAPASPTKGVTKLKGSTADKMRAKPSKSRLWMVALVAGVALVVGVGLFLILGPSLSSPGGGGEGEGSAGGESREGGAGRPGDRDKPDPRESRAVKRWKNEKHPKLTAVSGKVSWAVKMENNKAPYLRILSQVPMKTGKIEKFYTKSLELYPKMLASERVKHEMIVRPLVIVFLGPKIFNDKSIWGAEEGADVRYYPLPVATLFLPAKKEVERSAVLYGIASHLCPARLSGSQCHKLAERFEKYSATR